jgi:hypothetical protein
MSIENFFTIDLKNPVCIEGISEDALRAWIDALVIRVSDKSFGGFVLSSPGAQVKFHFPDGNFQGVTARVNGKDIVIIPGVKDNGLGIFYGAPSDTNPGPGWEVDAGLTQKYLNQPPIQNNWEIFYAKRVAVLNSP